MLTVNAAGQVLACTFNPPDGSSSGCSTSINVTIASATSGAQIRYTLDGSTPTSSTGTLINGSSGTITISGITAMTKGVRAIAFKAGMTDSIVTLASYSYDCGGQLAPPSGTASAASFTVSGGSSYLYDAQNRLISATVNGITETFRYDGLNRKYSQTIQGVTTVNVWDGWNLIQEYNQGSTTPTYSYVYGVDGIDERLAGSAYGFYFHDALGNVTHFADSNGNLVEYYKYTRFGDVTSYNASNQVLTTSAYDIRHLYTGQPWIPQIGLYDLRNRVYSPAVQRFMQTDPIGFSGDANNLYRYCENSSVSLIDPEGLVDWGEFWTGAFYATSGGLSTAGILVTEAPSFGLVTVGLPIAIGGTMKGVAMMSESLTSSNQHLAPTLVADPYNAMIQTLPQSWQPYPEIALAGYSIYDGVNSAYQGDKATYFQSLNNVNDIGNGLFDLGSAISRVVNPKKPFEPIMFGIGYSGGGGGGGLSLGGNFQINDGWTTFWDWDPVNGWGIQGREQNDANATHGG